MGRQGFCSERPAQPRREGIDTALDAQLPLTISLRLHSHCGDCQHGVLLVILKLCRRWRELYLYASSPPPPSRQLRATRSQQALTLLSAVLRLCFHSRAGGGRVGWRRASFVCSETRDAEAILDPTQGLLDPRHGGAGAVGQPVSVVSGFYLCMICVLAERHQARRTSRGEQIILTVRG